MKKYQLIGCGMDIDPNVFLDGLRRAMADMAVRHDGPEPTGDGDQAPATADGSAVRPTPPGAGDIRMFRRVLVEAELTMDLAASSGDRLAILLAPMLHTTACHNLAVAVTATGDVEAGRNLRRRMVATLVERAACADLPMALRINCVRHLRPALDLCCGACVDEADRRALVLVAVEARRVAMDVMREANDGLERGRHGPGEPVRVGPALLH